MQYVEIPVPSLKKGEVLIKVEAASINPADCRIQKGLLRPFVPKFPFIPGIDAFTSLFIAVTVSTDVVVKDITYSPYFSSWICSMNLYPACCAPDLGHPRQLSSAGAPATTTAPRASTSWSDAEVTQPHLTSEAWPLDATPPPPRRAGGHS
uniref:Alcohol dehydrogenase-like N-terminal domain-containing protein n=1 Tax=Aegilops tauschii subsp. strangulata TaxID=200361 RepID=A0A453BTR4_AEGTS